VPPPEDTPVATEGEPASTDDAAPAAPA